MRIPSTTRITAPYLAPVVLVTVVASVLVATPSVAAEQQECLGRPATIAQHTGTVVGTAGADVIVLRGKGRVIGGAGDDLVCGSAFADDILGGAGDDVILGGPGDDTVRGGAGSDRLYGDSGDDRVAGGSGRDQLFGATGVDTLAPGAGRDTVAQDGTVVLLTASQSDVQMLRMTGMRFGVAAGSRAGAQAVWATADPMSLTQLVLGPQLAGFAASPGDGNIDPFVQADITAGQTMTLSADNTVSVRSSGAAGEIGLVNNGIAMYQVGLLGRAIVNGSPAWGVVSTFTSAPGTQRTTSAPRSAVLFTTSSQGNDPLTSLPADAVDIDLASGDTVSFVYSGGRFSRR